MRTAWTAQEVCSFREDGFLVVPDFLDAEELAVWREAVDEAVAEDTERRVAAMAPASAPQLTPEQQEQVRYYQRIFTQRVNLWQKSAKVRGLILDERVGKLVADLAGVEGVRIWHDQALIKEPYGNVTSFHFDNPYHSFTSPDEVSLWVALDDATLENGCLHYVPGSHRGENHTGVEIGKDLGAVFELYPEWKGVAPVACPVPAGGACFHNGRTFHGAGANLTHGRRRAMTCIFMPDGSTYNGQPNVLPPPYAASLTVGDVLDNDDQNPLIYSRAGEPTAALSASID